MNTRRRDEYDGERGGGVSACIHGGHDGLRGKLARWLVDLGYRVVDMAEVPAASPSLSCDEPGPQIAFFVADSMGASELRRLRETSRRMETRPVVVVATSRDPHAVVEAVKHGATDYLAWPLDAREAEAALCRVLTRFVHTESRDWCNGCVSGETCTMDRLREFLGALAGTPALEGDALRDDYPFLVGSPAMREIDRVARRLSDSDLTVLIRGASGTGKEVVARHLHRTSARRAAPFVKVNCAALPEALLESELFGYERGAFTGAMAHRKGKFEEAQGGTILLDEISEMSIGLQAKLLEVLQDKHFSRLGGTGTVTVDTRILVTTNRDLEEEVEQGRFREDLYFRLKVIDLYLPLLKDRREEIPLLLDYFCCRFARQFRRPAPKLGERASRMLLSYDWPGNVRELENLVKRAVVLGEDSVLNELTESQMKRRRAGGGAASPPRGRDCVASALKEAAARAALATERELILSALQQTRWNRKEAARLLGVSYRTIRSKIKHYALETS